MPFLRSRDGDVCPLNGERIHSFGATLQAPGKMPWEVIGSFPCQHTKTIDGHAYIDDARECPFLSQSWAGTWNATVRCKFKKEQQ